MMEMKIKIDVPELVAAVEKLAAAIDKTALNITVPNEGTLNFNMPAGNAPAVPVTAPTYTLDQIAKAGANLVDAGKMEQLLALLTKYGVQAVTQLTPDQYGAFATELRALGAQI